MKKKISNGDGTKDNAKLRLPVSHTHMHATHIHAEEPTGTYGMLHILHTHARAHTHTLHAHAMCKLFAP